MGVCSDSTNLKVKQSARKLSVQFEANELLSNLVIVLYSLSSIVWCNCVLCDSQLTYKFNNQYSQLMTE